MVDQDDVIAKLEKLRELRDAGVLSQAELETQKAALLGQVGQATCSGCGAPLQLTPERCCVYCGTFAPGTAQAQFAAPAAGGNAALADAIFARNPTKKIQAIKELRQATGLGLKEAKDLIDAAEQRARR